MEIKDLKPMLDDIQQKAAKAAALEGRVAEIEGNFATVERKLNDALLPGAGGFLGGPDRQAKEHLDMFVRHLRRPRDMGLRSELAGIETKTASGLTDAAGGVLVPEILLSRIYDRVKDQTAMRRLASIASVSSGDVKFPVNKNDATSNWVGELDERTGTTTPTLLERKPTTGTVYSYVACSEELFSDAAFDIGTWFAMTAGDELSYAEGAAFISGNGTNKPTGILATTPVADLDASPAPDSKALLYVPTGAAGAFPEDRLGSPAGDPVGVLWDAVYSLKAQHRAAGTWLMNSATAKVLAKWRDADGRNLWQPAMTAGAPATLLGYPVALDESMPDIGSNSHPILFGDFARGYLIADVVGLRVSVDDNISQPGLVKWYLRKRVGGIVADNRAVVAIKCAAS